MRALVNVIKAARAGNHELVSPLEAPRCVLNARISKSRRFATQSLALPRLPIFGDDDDDEEEDEVDHIESEIVSAYQFGYGRWAVRLEDGSTWMQTDNTPIAARPRAGQPVRVNRGALGSYMMRVNGQPGVRVRRQI